MTTGRYAPPRQPSRMTVAEMASFVIEHPGLWIFNYRHDDGCPTIRTQRADDCQCHPDLRLVSHDGKLSFDIEGAL